MLEQLSIIVLIVVINSSKLDMNFFFNCFLINFHNRSMRLRFGLYGGKNTRSIFRYFASLLTIFACWYRALSKTICIFLFLYLSCSMSSNSRVSRALIVSVLVMVVMSQSAKLIALKTLYLFRP